jgi:hypothetical protein
LSLRMKLRSFLASNIPLMGKMSRILGPSTRVVTSSMMRETHLMC